MDAFALLVAATLNAGTVLAFAALGLLISERSGIVNLGAEGMMLVAAIAGFAVAVHSGSVTLGFAAGAGVGALMAGAFGLLGPVASALPLMISHCACSLRTSRSRASWLTPSEAVRMITPASLGTISLSMSLSRLRSTSGSLRLIPAAPPEGT